MIHLNVTRAAKILGVSLKTLTPQSLRAAYVIKLRAAHPDTGSGSRYTIRQLQEARKALETWLAIHAGRV